MKQVYLKEDQVVAMLIASVKKTGSQKKWGDQNKVSQQFVNDIVHGRRSVTDRVSSRLGFKRIVLFEAI